MWHCVTGLNRGTPRKGAAVWQKIRSDSHTAAWAWKESRSGRPALPPTPITSGTHARRPKPQAHR